MRISRAHPASMWARRDDQVGVGDQGAGEGYALTFAGEGIDVVVGVVFGRGEAGFGEGGDDCGCSRVAIDAGEAQRFGDRRFHALMPRECGERVRKRRERQHAPRFAVHSSRLPKNKCGIASLGPSDQTERATRCEQRFMRAPSWAKRTAREP